jgi:hypothetical protein
VTDHECTVPTLQHVLHLEIAVDDGLDVGVVASGLRRIVPISGGRVSGPLFTGRILPGGADVQLVRTPTETVVDARYALASDRGEVVLVRNVGIRTGTAEDLRRLQRDEPVDPARVYFRSTPTFETAAPRLSRLNTHVFVGSGTRTPGHVTFDVYEVQ